MGKTGGRGALVTSLPRNSSGASGITFCRNNSYNGQHQALSAQLASAFCHREGLEGKILLPTGVVWGAVPED